MTGFTKAIMLLSLLVVIIGGGFSFYLTYQSNDTPAVAYANRQGIAIEGFDAVAYHMVGQPTKGKENFQVTWAGTTWYFISLENRQAFSQDPEKFAPAFGGHDPYGMASGGLSQPATPELWEVSDGKLYLFYSGQTRRLWQQDKAENLKKANVQWNRIKQQIRYKAEMAAKDKTPAPLP